MNKIGYVTVIYVFYLLISDVTLAQTTQPKLDQLKLVQALTGTWQRNISKDTIEVWETKQHGKAIVHTGHLIIKGKKSFDYIDSYCFSSKEDKFKGFIIYPNGVYYTWLGSFTSDKKMVGNFVQDFNPETVTGKFELEIETPKSTTYTILDAKVVKTLEFKYSKTK
jgi:hypothetical protein